MTRSILKNVSTVSLALGLAAGLSQITLLAQSPGQQSTPPHESQKSETFVGKIVKASNGQFALLTDEKGGKGAYLDDQEKAKQFEGKSVKVIGVMMASSNMIHVTDIQPA
ncbi:MAG TPA: hypothetical protein VNH18_14965 [Bryobacteraceae bacterium]|nr:hypothetical protein [Bryobacteraceae bacterium]